METFEFDPVLPAPLIAALACAGVLAVLLYAFWRPTRLSFGRRAVLAALHLIPLLGLIVLLCRPSFVTISGATGAKPILSVLIDSSASMAADDAENGSSRFKLAVAAVKENLATWSSAFDVRFKLFDRNLRGAADVAELERTVPNGTATDLAAVQQAVGENVKPDLLLLFSDGIHNAPSDLHAAARAARAAGVPVFTHGLGANVVVKDIGVSLSAAEELAFVRQALRIPVTITQTGFDNAQVEVELRDGEKTLQKKTIRFEKGAAEVVTEFVVSCDAPGLFTYDVIVPPRKNEAVTSNNRRRVTLRVINERIPILFVEGKPYWDSKFLVRVLRRDPNVLLTTALQIRSEKVLYEPAGSEDEAPVGNTPAVAAVMPADPAKPLEDRAYLGSFQVVMLGRDTDAFLTPKAVENLRDWMARSGGHLVCTRGRPVLETTLTPALSAVLPVAWKSDSEKHLQVKLTERGRSLALFDAAASPQGGVAAQADDPNVVLKSLPSLVTATSVEKERSLTVVLARGTEGNGEPMAVLSVQNYGSGKAVVLEGQGMWRWGFRTPSQGAPGSPGAQAPDVFGAFWSNMIRWLAGSNEFLPSQDVALRSGKPLYQAGERPVLYVSRRETETSNAASKLTRPKDYPIEIARSGGAAGGVSKATAQPVPHETNLFQTELEPLEEGQYVARLANVTPKVEAIFEVLPPLKELLDLRARPDVLADLSALTDGKALDKNELATLGTLYHAFVKQHFSGSEHKRPAWDQPWILGAFLAWFAAFWWTRRRWGAI